MFFSPLQEIINKMLIVLKYIFYDDIKQLVFVFCFSPFEEYM